MVGSNFHPGARGFQDQAQLLSALICDWAMPPSRSNLWPAEAVVGMMGTGPRDGGVVVLEIYNTNGAATGRAQSLAVPKPVSYRGTGEWRVAAGRLGQVFRHVRRQHLGLSSSVAFFGFLDMLVSSG